METPTITPVNIEEEMRQSYMDYAMSVIIGRALPDVRDGLKPVQRRVLYAMMGEGLASNRKHSKCAGVVGEVLKRLHPHGDSSVYEALVRLAQPWNLRYPLVDGQGNFGSIDGDPPAAYRYTECRMTQLAEKLLEDIERETVDFIPNFDDSNIEPTVLPAALPNLLINGADGIAVGMATHIPPHNLGEVITATIALIENPQISLGELMHHIPGPDFPTGGLIYGRAPIVSAYAHGKGVLQVRAKTNIETTTAKSREVQAIIVTEIPFQVNKARLIEKIAELVNGKEIDGIARLRDESDRTGMRIVIELKRDATAEVVLNQLFKLTPMQTSFGVINLAIVDGKPVVCSLTELLTHFINHRRDVVTRRTQFDLKKAQERMHLLEGFKIALLNLDAVIQLIKSSPTPKDARDGLQATYGLSELQAQAILDLRLQKLTGMERLAIEQEYAELAKEIERLLGLLADNRRIDELICTELTAVREAFTNPRRTEIIDDGADIAVEDLIEDEEMVVSVSHKGYIKRTKVSEYRAQKRGGKGIAGAASSDESDFIEHLFVTSSLANLMVFTTLGRAYGLKVYEAPETSRTAKGRALVNLLQLRPDEGLATILPLRDASEDQSIVFCTKDGTVKKTLLSEFKFLRKNGIIACNIKENDRLVSVRLVSPSEDIIIATHDGMAIRFDQADLRECGRAATGVRGIRLADNDYVIGMTVVPAAPPGAPETAEVPDSAPVSDETVPEALGDAPTLLTVCANGYGKRTPVTQYRKQSRAGMGLIDIQTGERNGPAVGICIAQSSTQIMMITSSGQIIRFNAADVLLRSRNTMGVKLIDLGDNEKVVTIAAVEESVDEERNGN
jgi:DNA gyrase subunit A